MRSIQFVSLVLLSLLPVMASQYPPESMRIEGRVVNALSGAPIRRARVSYQPFSPAGGTMAPTETEQAEELEILTDGEGRFTLPPLAPGDYTVMAQRDGFYPERRRPTRFRIEAGLVAPSVDLRLVPYSVITGRVLDEEGEPVRSATVTARRYVYTQSGRALDDGPSTRTDDLGEYRLFDIAPGRYLVQAQPLEQTDFNPVHPGAATSLLSGYYPGVGDASAASVVDLNAGRRLQGVDIALRRGHIPTVRGRVVAPAGASKLLVTLHYEDGFGATGAGFDVRNDQGNFTLHGIREGVYVLSAQCETGGRKLLAKIPLRVGSSDIEGLELRPAPSVSLKGRMQIEGAPPSRVKGLGVWLTFGGSDGAAGQSECSYIHEDNGSFSFNDKEQGSYRASFESLADLYLKSMRLGSSDVTDEAFDVTAPDAGELVVVVSAKTAVVEGRVTDGKAQPVESAEVTFAPDATGARAKRLFRTVKTDTQGRFPARGLAPGVYRLMSWDSVEPYRVLYDAEFVSLYAAQATRLELSEGEHKSVELVAIETNEK